MVNYKELSKCCKAETNFGVCKICNGLNICVTCKKIIYTAITMTQSSELVCSECEKKIANGLLTIDVDLIRQLRLTGRSELAEDLLAAYHKNKKENNESNRKEIATLYDKIEKHRKTVNNICVVRGCMTVAEWKWKTCIYHHNKDVEYKNKWRVKNNGRISRNNMETVREQKDA